MQGVEYDIIVGYEPLTFCHRVIDGIELYTVYGHEYQTYYSITFEEYISLKFERLRNAPFIRNFTIVIDSSE